MDDADHAGAADTRHHLVAAERLELFGDRAGGAVHVEQQFRMGVQVLPPGGDLMVQVGDAVDDRHGTLRAAWAAPISLANPGPAEFKKAGGAY